MPGNT